MFINTVKLFALIILLNLIRYYVIGIVESMLILDGVFGAMEASAGYFNSEFTTFLWVSSYLYNFLMWSIVVVVYHLFHPSLTGNSYFRSLQIFSLMWFFFAAVSLIYMNHYSHPMDFYLWNIADALLVYLLLALANGFFYPLFFNQISDKTDKYADS